MTKVMYKEKMVPCVQQTKLKRLFFFSQWRQILRHYFKVTLNKDPAEPFSLITWNSVQVATVRQKSLKKMIWIVYRVKKKGQKHMKEIWLSFEFDSFELPPRWRGSVGSDDWRRLDSCRFGRGLRHTSPLLSAEADWQLTRPTPLVVTVTTCSAGDPWTPPTSSLHRPPTAHAGLSVLSTIPPQLYTKNTHTHTPSHPLSQHSSDR